MCTWSREQLVTLQCSHHVHVMDYTAGYNRNFNAEHTRLVPFGSDHWNADAYKNTIQLYIKSIATDNVAHDLSIITWARPSQTKPANTTQHGIFAFGIVAPRLLVSAYTITITLPHCGPNCCSPGGAAFAVTTHNATQSVRLYRARFQIEYTRIHRTAMTAHYNN